MDTDIRPALRRLVHALRHGADVSAVMLRILDDAEQAAARIDWSGGGVGKASAPNATDTPTFTGVGAPGLAFTPLGAALAAVRAAAEQARLGDDGGARVKRGGAPSSRVNQQVGTPTPQTVEPTPDTPAERSERYDEWTVNLIAAGGAVSCVTFFSAAADVTALLGIAEDDQLLGQVGGGLGMVSELMRRFLDLVGEVLYGGPTAAGAAAAGVDMRGNVDIYAGLMDGSLITPGGQLISPLTGQPVSSGLEFDIHMVYWEQARVGGILSQTLAAFREDGQEGRFWEMALSIDQLLGYAASWQGEIIIPGDQSFLAWANSAARTNDPRMDRTTNISFGDPNHRHALGIALIFQNHFGNTPQARQMYLDYMASAWGQTVPPPVPFSDPCRPTPPTTPGQPAPSTTPGQPTSSATPS